MIAIVLGATGAIGKPLVNLLINDERFSKVKCLTRRELPIKSDKLEQIVIDFDKEEEWKHLVKGDVLFSTFGTTIKKAGSKDRQFQIDYTYQYLVAKNAAENGVKQYVLISSSGANPKSRFFYPRMKGKLDADVSKLGFNQLIILKPSVLDASREESRLGEGMAIKVGNALATLSLLSRYKPIKVEHVAQAMVNSVFLGDGFTEFVLDEVYDLAFIKKEPT